MKVIPKSLLESMTERPEDFLKYLNLDKIAKSKKPYKNFLNEFKKNFSGNQGLNLWRYIEGRYKLLNELYKSEILQSLILQEKKENFLGSLKRKETKDFFTKQEEAKKKEKIKPEKTFFSGGYKREGKEIKGYYKTKPTKYSDRQRTFILSRKNYPLQKLTDDFNYYFKTAQTKIALRDKRL